MTTWKGLRVLPEDVDEMSQRLEAQDVSLDAPVGDGTATHVDFVSADGPAADALLGEAEEGRALAAGVTEALARLDERERYIVEHRLMADRPETLKDLGVWFELVNLVVPTYTDNLDTIRRMCAWILKTLGPDQVLHFSRFHPQHQLTHLPPTPVGTLVKAREVARAEALHYVYVGNVYLLQYHSWCNGIWDLHK